MERKEYNGWTNYETWVVKLWMDNDEGSYHYFAELAEEKYRDADEDDAWKGATKLESATSALGSAIEDWHEEMQPTVTGVFADLINASMSEVNWHEIAASLLEDVEKEPEEESEESEAI